MSQLVTDKHNQWSDSGPIIKKHKWTKDKLSYCWVAVRSTSPAVSALKLGRQQLCISRAIRLRFVGRKTVLNKTRVNCAEVSLPTLCRFLEIDLNWIMKKTFLADEISLFLRHYIFRRIWKFKWVSQKTIKTEIIDVHTSCLWKVCALCFQIQGKTTETKKKPSTRDRSFMNTW